MSLSVAARNIMVESLGDAIAYASIHTADPGTTGANAIETARQIAIFGAPSNGMITLADLVFTIPADTTPTHIGYWTAVTGGTFLYGDNLDAVETFANEGELTITAATITMPS